MSRRWVWSFFLLSSAMLGCAPPDPLATPQTSPTPEQESSLLLETATLEQTNAQGQVLWKVQVKTAKYAPNRQSEINSRMVVEHLTALQVLVNRHTRR